MDADHILMRDLRWTLAWAGVILAVSCLPYIIAWAATPSGYQYGGIVVNPFDGYSYLAKMRQGWLGSWQFHLTYTPEPHEGAYIFLFYLALGHFARLTGLPLILVYHLARLSAGLALLITTCAFLTRLTADRQERHVACWLVGTSAGLGWLGLVLGAFPIDLWVPEAFAFFSLMSNPHFPLAIALMLGLVAGVIWPAGGVRRWLVPGIAGLALALIQPFALASIYATLALYLLLRGWMYRSWPLPESVAAAGIVMLSLPVLLYDYMMYTVNPVLSAWASQNITPAPPVLDLILGYGLVGLLAIAGGIVVARQRDHAGLALLAWGVTTLILVYMPFALQRRFLTGLGVPLGILASVGLARWLRPRLPAARARLVTGLTIGLGLVGNLFLLLVLILGVLSREAQPDLFARLYLSRDEMQAMKWLLARPQNEVVLASPRTGMFLPGQAGVRVVAGHPFETADAEVKQAQAEAFFRNQLAGKQCQDIQVWYDIRYVFVGPAEQALGGGNACLSGVVPVYRQGKVAIYQLSER